MVISDLKSLRKTRDINQMDLPQLAGLRPAKLAEIEHGTTGEIYSGSPHHIKTTFQKEIEELLFLLLLHDQWELLTRLPFSRV